MRKNNINNLVINVNREKDDVEFSEDGMKIISENGIRLDIPYEKAEVETKDKKIIFENSHGDYKVKKKK